MIVFSYGIPKSGSTLAFQILRAVAFMAGSPQWRLPAPLCTPGHRVNFQQRLDPGLLRETAARAKGRILVIKTHDAPRRDWAEAYRDLAARGEAAAVLCHRDPRDICLALLDAGRLAREAGDAAFAEYAALPETAARVGRYLAELERWRGLPRVLDLRYETCAFRMDEAIGAVKEHLGVRCPTWPVRLYAGHIAFTHRNKAVPERHLAELTPEERAPLDAAFGAYLDLMGYRGVSPAGPSPGS